MTEQLTQVWSCGGGVQSSAIAALIIAGKLPKPDFSAIVDTNRERSATWKWCDEILTPELARAGVTLHRINKRDYATVDLTRNGSVLMPGYSGGGGGKMDNYCSNEWKKRPLQRWLREQGVKQCECWMGMTTDEMQRVKASTEGWFQKRYPLIFDIEPALSRRGCMEIVKDMGWPEPPRSSCWMCPNVNDDQWKELKEEWPKDWAAAVALEKKIRRDDPDFFFHRSGRPLDQVDLHSQPGLFEDDGGCDTGFCFV